jgi:hypothetical protein
MFDDNYAKALAELAELRAQLAAANERAEKAENIGFEQGLGYAIAYVWGRGEGVIAKELWGTQWKDKKVPSHIDEYDAKKIKEMLRFEP